MGNFVSIRKNGNIGVISVKMIFILLISITLIAGGLAYFKFQYGEDPVMKDITSPIKTVTPEAWENLSKRAFFFGHQSVGNDLTDGIHEVLMNNPQIKLEVTEGRDPGLVKAGIFLHEHVGENEKPDSKIADFSSSIEAGIGEKGVLAFLKFCFVDIDRNTDIEELFSDYQERFHDLKRKYPGSTFVHFTVPLMTVDRSLVKGNIKKLLGRGQFASNVARNRYNQLLKDTYFNIDPVFDLAYYESISSVTGEMSITRGLDGKKYLSLSKDNSSDGGHLNESGKRWVAENFLAFLALLND